MSKQIHFLIDGRVNEENLDEHYEKHIGRFIFYYYYSNSPNVSCYVEKGESSSIDLMVRVVQDYLTSIIEVFTLGFYADFKVRDLAIYALFFYFHPKEEGLTLRQVITSFSFFQGLFLWDFEAILPLTYYTEMGFKLFEYRPLGKSNEVFFVLNSDIKQDLDILLTNLCLGESRAY